MRGRITTLEETPGTNGERDVDVMFDEFPHLGLWYYTETRTLDRRVTYIRRVKSGEGSPIFFEAHGPSQPEFIAMIRLDLDETGADSLSIC